LRSHPEVLAFRSHPAAIQLPFRSQSDVVPFEIPSKEMKSSESAETGIE
jgi:hypothetical protein